MSKLPLKCSGCGIETPDKIRRCECATSCLYRRPEKGKTDSAAKFRGCVNHPDRKIRENLDGDNLCLECCIAWAKNEGVKSE